MTEDNETVTLRDALEAALADRAANEPGFFEAALLDPRGTVEELAAQMIDDDGDLDLSGINVNIHVQTPESIHLVLAASPSEVEGFRFGGGAFQEIGGLSMGFRVRPWQTGATETSCSGCNSTCHTDTGSTNHCAGGSCRSSAVL